MPDLGLAHAFAFEISPTLGLPGNGSDQRNVDIWVIIALSLTLQKRHTEPLKRGDSSDGTTQNQCMHVVGSFICVDHF